MIRTVRAALAVGILMSASLTAFADGHETVDGLKAELAGMEKKMAAVAKDRDALAEQLLSTIEELEAAEAEVESVNQGRDYIAGRLEQLHNANKTASSEHAAALAQLESEADDVATAATLQIEGAINERNDARAQVEAAQNELNFNQILLKQAQGEAAASKTEVERLQKELNFNQILLKQAQGDAAKAASDAESMAMKADQSSGDADAVAEAAFVQIQSAIGERDDALAQVAAAEEQIARLERDMQSTVNGRDYIEGLLKKSRDSSNAQAAELDALKSANASLTRDLESTINGRDYIEGLLGKSKEAAAAQADEAAANAAALQAQIDSVTTGRDYLAERLQRVFAESKQQQAGHDEAIAALEAEIKTLKSSGRVTPAVTADSAWAARVTTNLRERLRGLTGVEVAPVSGNRVNIRVGNSGLFRAGSADLSTEGQALMTRIGRQLAQQDDARITVTGHTDNIPTSKGSRFADNMDLSIQRATQAMNQMANTANIGFDRMTASGLADTAPIASNATDSGRALNRRVEILLTPLK